MSCGARCGTSRHASSCSMCQYETRWKPKCFFAPLSKTCSSFSTRVVFLHKMNVDTERTGIRDYQKCLNQDPIVFQDHMATTRSAFSGRKRLPIQIGNPGLFLLRDRISPKKNCFALTTLIQRSGWRTVMSVVKLRRTRNVLMIYFM